MPFILKQPLAGKFTYQHIPPASAGSSRLNYYRREFFTEPFRYYGRTVTPADLEPGIYPWQVVTGLGDRGLYFLVPSEDPASPLPESGSQYQSAGGVEKGGYTRTMGYLCRITYMPSETKEQVTVEAVSRRRLDFKDLREIVQIAAMAGVFDEV